MRILSTPLIQISKFNNFLSMLILILNPPFENSTIRIVILFATTILLGGKVHIFMHQAKAFRKVARYDENYTIYFHVLYWNHQTSYCHSKSFFLSLFFFFLYLCFHAVLIKLSYYSTFKWSYTRPIIYFDSSWGELHKLKLPQLISILIWH